MTEPTPAATVIVFRAGRSSPTPEILMLERSATMRFAAGACVFPGGRVDPEDHELARWVSPGLPVEDGAARIAAVRETLEEAGLLLGVNEPVTAADAAAARALLLETGALAPVLARYGWSLDLARLIPFARWCPPSPRAFDTRFFLADLGTGAIDLAADGTENQRLFWASAAASLAMFARGEISAIFPTLRNLERLAGFADFAAATAEASRITPTTIAPWIEERGGVPHLVIPEGLGYPVTAQPLATVRRG